MSLTNPHDICCDLAAKSIQPRTAEMGPPLPANFNIAPDEPEFVVDCRRREYYGNELNFTQHWTRDAVHICTPITATPKWWTATSEG